MNLRGTPPVFLAVICLLAVACSRSEEDIDALTAKSPTPSPVDPWKAAAEWPVPAGPVGDAQRFLLGVPAYQYTQVTEDRATHQKSRYECRVVHNEALAMESDGTYGKNGIVTDGKIEYVLYQGRYGKEPGDAAATLMEQLRAASLQSVLNHSEEHAPFLGLEKVDGVEAEVYALIARPTRPLPAWGTGDGYLRVWLAKDNHRPLKVELKEDREIYQSSGVHASIGIGVYRYDPNVKVTIPDS